MSGRVAYSIKNPRLAGPPDLDRDNDFELVTSGGRVDLDYYDALDETRERQYRAPARQTVLELYDRLEERGKGYLERARARAALADYLRHTMHAAYPWGPYGKLADDLDAARKHGLWGVGEIWHAMNDDGTQDCEPALAVKWTGRAGQVKLCPDDAREESMRATSLYLDRLDELVGEGFAVRYAVFTIPNSPLGFLRADLDAIFERLRREIVYARTDGTVAKSMRDRRRRFPELVGALATLEAPLSARGDWNVHLNVLLVFSSRPDYGALREAWGANVEFQQVPEGAERAALAELIKYPLKAVAFKSDEKSRSGSRAPPVIEWPAHAFHEWWTAHKGFRRTRSWGTLYAGSLPDDERERIMPHTIEWLGKLYLSASRFYAQRAMPDTTRADERADSADTPRPRQIDFEELQRVRDLFSSLYHEPAPTRAAGLVDLILGNKSASESSAGCNDPPRTGSLESPASPETTNGG